MFFCPGSTASVVLEYGPSMVGDILKCTQINKLLNLLLYKSANVFSIETSM
jgi:hypothetical protein